MSSVSPCVGICKLDEATGFCLGCARTGDEIADWQSRANSWRADVWDALPARFEALGIACRRLPWDTKDIRSFVLQSLDDGRGTWTAGVVGAVAEFAAAPGQRIEADLDGQTIVARTPGARLKFKIDEYVRALTFDPNGTPKEKMRVVLAVKKGRGSLAPADTLTPRGPDYSAIEPANRDSHLFDLGLGRKEVRFSVRVGPGRAFDVLSSAHGTAFPDSLPVIAPTLIEQSPARVIETALGRIEVLTPIPGPDEKSPRGPHTHLLPDHLATGRATPVGIDLPKVYFPGAMLYPGA